MAWYIFLSMSNLIITPKCFVSVLSFIILKHFTSTLSLLFLRSWAKKIALPELLSNSSLVNFSLLVVDKGISLACLEAPLEYIFLIAMFSSVSCSTDACSWWVHNSYCLNTASQTTTKAFWTRAQKCGVTRFFEYSISFFPVSASWTELVLIILRFLGFFRIMTQRS